MLNVNRTRAMEGKTSSQGAVCMDTAPDCRMEPSDTSGALTPRPRYDSAVSELTAPTTPSTVLMMIIEARFGMR